MKTITSTLPWAMMLLAQVNAQDDVDNDRYTTTEDNVVTSYYTLCPSSTTWTGLTSTSWSTSTVTSPPNQLTRTGDDGRITVYRTETTIFPHMCPGNDGVCGATYTLSEDCPFSGPKTTWTHGTCPEGFTTGVVACTACAQNGGPSSITVTTPIPSGPYASVTPKYGSPVANPSDICKDTATGAPDTSNSTTGSGPDKYNSNNTTKPYGPTSSYKPYAGAAGKLEISLAGCASIIGVGVVGALAVLL